MNPPLAIATDIFINESYPSFKKLKRTLSRFCLEVSMLKSKCVEYVENVTKCVLLGKGLATL